MKKFKYKFSKPITALSYVACALCAVGFIFNILSLIYRDVSTAKNLAYPIIQYTLMFGVTVFLFIVLISMLINSYYAIKGDKLISCFGIIKSKFEISDITTLLLDRNTNKLTVYFKNNNFIVIKICDEWQSEFIDAMCEANKQIEFSINSKQNTPDDTENK